MINRQTRHALRFLALASFISQSASIAFGQEAVLLPPVPLESTPATEPMRTLRSILEVSDREISLHSKDLADYIPHRGSGRLRDLPPPPLKGGPSPFQLASEPLSSKGLAEIAVPGFQPLEPREAGPSRSDPSAQTSGNRVIVVPDPSESMLPSRIMVSNVQRTLGEIFTPSPPLAPSHPQGHYSKEEQPPNFLAASSGGPFAYSAVHSQPVVDPAARLTNFSYSDFLPVPMSPIPYDPVQEALVYRGRMAVPVQRPWVEFWRPFYTSGTYPPAPDVFGKTNLLFPSFLVYGDYRTGVGINRNQNGNARSWANRLNLELDLKLTATERFHGFVGPLDNNNQFTRLDFSSNRVEFQSEMDFKPDTLFFEGDLGAIAGGLTGVDSQFDLPFTLGLVPLLYQNGIWMEDAVVGAAVAIPARNSPALAWSNFDATFFVGLDQITSNAFQGNQSASQVFGTAWFIDAYDGFIEADYAFVRDDEGRGRSYNNASLAFTRRYLSRLSNSVRLISNFGQNGPTSERTADGFLVLVENSLISATPNTLVPYANFFYGSGRPQSVARAAGSGGILRNTGINFETDGLTGYPTLDPTGFNSYGMALGMNMLGQNFRDQLVLELAALGTYGNRIERTAPGDQYAAGARYQRPLTNAWLVRLDAMYGLLRNSDNIAGGRMELRWKF